ncbi:hypothetical protein ABMA58_04295 [Oceanospirillum sp. HFRX-1_2]
MSDIKKQQKKVESDVRKDSASKETGLRCDVCLSQGVLCAAMTQQLFSGKAENIDCDLLRHCF